MFYQISLSPQVKRWAVITYKHGIYELPNDLSLGSQEIRKYQKIVYTPQNDSPAPRPPAKIKISLALAKKSRKIAVKPLPRRPAPTKTRLSLKYPVTNCSQHQKEIKPDISAHCVNYFQFISFHSRLAPKIFMISIEFRHNAIF